MNLDFEDFIGLIEKALEKKRDESFFAVWKGLVPFMNDNTFVSFDDYKSRMLKSNMSGESITNIPENDMTDEEAIEDAKSIVSMLKIDK